MEVLVTPIFTDEGAELVIVVECKFGEVLVSAFEVTAEYKVVLFVIFVVVLSTLFVLGYIVCVIAEEGKTRTKFDVKLVATGNVVLANVVAFGNKIVDVG
jgi:hypothetical protein